MQHFLSRACHAVAVRLENASRRLEPGSGGARVRRYRDCVDTVSALLRFHRPRHVCDVGANAGHWTYVLGQLDPDLRQAVLFEPQTQYRDQLASLDLPGVEKVIYPFALGAKAGSATLKGGTPSASLLDAERTQDTYFPGTFDRGAAEEVRIEVLDDVYARDNLPNPDLLKLDVQGFELDVLRGAEGVLSQAKYLVMELSFQAFYAGQPPLWELLRFLHERHYVMVAHGFEWRSATPPGELLQMDGIFLNTAAE